MNPDAPRGAGGLLRRTIPAPLRGIIRRHAGELFVTRETLEYENWIRQRVEERKQIYTDAVPQELFSILTPVWDGTPVQFFRNLARSITRQNESGACEWVILDNGCSRPALRQYLAGLRELPWVKRVRSDENVGIVCGLRMCLEQASGRYVLPVDADDHLFQDALTVVASFLRRSGYPAIAYTDEDKIRGNRHHEAYLKSDWDPVLFANSAYVAHLSIADREVALSVGAYTDPRTEGSADWDLFVRFVSAGYVPVHIPEVVYSWRVHASSTADHGANKSFIAASQKAVLERLLDKQPTSENFEIRRSPLVIGATEWHLFRLHTKPRKIVSFLLSHEKDLRDAAEIGPMYDYSDNAAFRISLGSSLRTLAAFLRKVAHRTDFVHLLGEEVRVDGTEWPWEALGLFELYPNAAMIGGCIRTGKGVVLSAGRYFGFSGVCGCPYKGRRSSDAGYFAQMWKQRSVSAVSTQFSVIRADFLLDLLDTAPAAASLAFLGAWAGARALRTGARVVYTPFLSGMSNLDWDQLVSSEERELFADLNSDLIPDHRFYSRHLSLEKPFALAKRDAKPMQRAAGV